MSVHIARTVRMLVLLSGVAMIDGCSKADDDYGAAAPDPTAHAQAVQSAISAARA